MTEMELFFNRVGLRSVAFSEVNYTEKISASN